MWIMLLDDAVLIRINVGPLMAGHKVAVGGRHEKNHYRDRWIT